MAMSMQELEMSLKNCQKCRLCEQRTNVVFGTGPYDARVMFIGEGPGQNEDEQGKPFVGRGGQLLDKMLDAVDLSRERNVFIANMVKCRPPQNRDPQPDETEACLPFLREQVRLIRPKMIVCLGRIAAMKLIKPDFKITQEHGKFFERGDFLISAVYHPALLLRDPHKKEDMLVDMKAIKAKLDEMR